MDIKEAEVQFELHKNGQLFIFGDWTSWYDEDTDDLLETCPVQVINAESFLDIDNERMVWHTKEDTSLVVVNSIGEKVVIWQANQLNIERTISNLIGLRVSEDFINDVICAFDTSSSEIIVSKDESNSHIDYQAYENKEDAPVICIRIEDGRIADAWEA